MSELDLMSEIQCVTLSDIWDCALLVKSLTNVMPHRCSVVGRPNPEVAVWDSEWFTHFHLNCDLFESDS